MNFDFPDTQNVYATTQPTTQPTPKTINNSSNVYINKNTSKSSLSVWFHSLDSRQFIALFLVFLVLVAVISVILASLGIFNGSPPSVSLTPILPPPGDVPTSTSLFVPVSMRF
jgi:hypothetical protein